MITGWNFKFFLKWVDVMLTLPSEANGACHCHLSITAWFNSDIIVFFIFSVVWLAVVNDVMQSNGLLESLQ